MIVPDGRADREKLFELLVATEQTHLEFKQRLGLDGRAGKLEFVKDIVAMSNRPEGGYLLVGVDDDGQPCIPTGKFDRRQFDGANFAALVRGYIDAEIEILTAVHDADGFEVGVIYVAGHRSGCPAPMNRDGTYSDDKGRQRFVFRDGEVLVREGPGIVPLRHVHWPELLSAYRSEIQHQAQQDVQALVAQVVRRLGSGPSLPPLLPEMDEMTLAEAVTPHLDSDSMELRRFLTQAIARAQARREDTAEFNRVLDQVATVACRTVEAAAYRATENAVATLEKLYDRASAPDTEHNPQRLIDIATRAYAIGSLAVRAED